MAAGSGSNNRLVDLRNQAGLTQEALAKAAGLSWIMIAKIEGGDTTPGLATLRKLSAVLGDGVFACQYGWRQEPKQRGRPRKVREETKSGN